MKLLAQLKQHGYRLTKPRQELLTTLSSYPLTVQQIHESLQKKNIRVDLASIYRSLELFVEMGIVHVIEFGEDKKRYEIVDHDNHHHHLLCNKCGTIEDITINESTLLTHIQTKSKFKIDHHHLEFFGLCQHCQ